MSKLKLIIPILFIGSLSFAQNNLEPCSFDYYQRQFKTGIQRSENIISEGIKDSGVYKKTLSGSVKVVPVVVHIIHNGGTENISDAQVQSQIDVLNEDYRKAAGTNGDGAGVDTEIEFCLAKLTPDGKCTNGIVRIQSTYTSHYTYQRTLLKNLSYWDNTRYLNIYVVKTINGSSGVAGYSSFPGGPPDEDGIVIRHNYFGKTGTAVAGTNGRTCTHEIGHWLGLYHTFNGGCGVDTCSDGDFVCDTPPANLPNFGCPSINSCNLDVPDVNDQIQNYMDYADDVCKDMFSAGQKARMMATMSTLRTVIWSAPNITATGCDSGYVSAPCNVVADFTSNAQSICVGNPVMFINKSLNSPASFQWYFSGGTPATSTLSNPTILYNTVGSFSVKLVAYGALGTDSMEIINYINVVTPPVGQALPFFEGFESFVFPPNGITIENADAGVTWERDTMAVQYAGMGSAKINNLVNINYGQSDAMLLPRFDFTTFTGTPYLNLKWAYARSDPSYSDELIVLVSKDCGVTWTQVLYRTGASLVTGPTQTTAYVPDSSTVWKNASVSLLSYASYSNVQIKIVNVTDGGNNLYVDNINIGAIPVGINEEEHGPAGLGVFPNPNSGIFTIQYSLLKCTSVNIQITDVLGREVYSDHVSERAPGIYDVPVNIDLRYGIYYVVLTSEDIVLSKKIMIR